jgi:hypothetical protein
MPKQKLDDMLVGHGPHASEQPEDEVTASAPRSVYQANKTFDASETMTPRLVLAQGLSPEVQAGDAKPGDFLLMGNEPVKEVVLVLAGHTKQRRYVPQGQQKAQCYSPDGVQGIGVPGIACAECPLSQWTDTGRKDASGKTINQRPACDEIDSFVAFSVTHGMPVVWPLKGTAAKAARFVKTLSNGLGMGNFAIKVTSEGRSNNGRAWHEPVIKIEAGVSKDEANVYRDIALGAVAVALPPATS